MRQLDVGRLEALLESARLLHGSLELEDLLKHLLRSVMGRLVASKGFVALDADGRMAVAVARGLKSFAVGTPIDDDAAREAGIDVVLPIGEASGPVGLLGVSRPLADEVTREEHEFLEALLGLAASAVANARAHDAVRPGRRRGDRRARRSRSGGGARGAQVGTELQRGGGAADLCQVPRGAARAAGGAEARPRGSRSAAARQAPRGAGRHPGGVVSAGRGRR